MMQKNDTIVSIVKILQQVHPVTPTSLKFTKELQYIQGILNKL